MTQQPIKRVLCQGFGTHQQCKTCVRHTEPPKPDAFKAPPFIDQKCPMRVQK